MTDKFPKVGLGVMITNENGEVLLGKRKGSHGEGEWCFPGGSLEFGETLTDCAKREVKEETGLELNEMELISVSDELKYVDSDGKHHVVIGFISKHSKKNIEVIEKDKWTEWNWFDLESLPEPLFEGTKQMIENLITGKVY